MGNSKLARLKAIANGHQPGMFRVQRISGKNRNRASCLHPGCHEYLADGAWGIHGTMLTRKCTGYGSNKHDDIQ